MGMELIMAAAMATAASSGCSWAHPGANPYRGDPVAALADFPMSNDTRRQLKALMAKHAYTDIVNITRNDIVGKHRYGDLRMMHNGRGQVCHGSVDRSKWGNRHVERGLVYCVGDTCVIVPTVCNNVSLVTRRPEQAAAADESPIDINPAAGPAAAAAPAATQNVASAGIPDSGPIEFMPPAAGTAAAGTGAADPSSGGGSFLPSPPTAGGGCCVIVPGTPVDTTPASPVPETPVWSLLLAGLTTLLTARRGRA